MSGTCEAEQLPVAGGFDQSQPVVVSKWYRWRKSGMAVADYLLDSEVHTYAFSVAANAIISFIPLIVLLYTIALSVFHSHGNGQGGEQDRGAVSAHHGQAG